MDSDDALETTLDSCLSEEDLLGMFGATPIEQSEHDDETNGEG